MVVDRRRCRILVARGEAVVLIRWLLKILREIWEFDPGKEPGSNRKAGIGSAFAGLAAALAVSAAMLLERKDYFSRVTEFLANAGLSGVWAPATAIIGLVVVICVVSYIGGHIVYRSSPGRSYIGYAWQGAATVVGGIVLYSIAWLIMSLVELVG